MSKYYCGLALLLGVYSADLAAQAAARGSLLFVSNELSHDISVVITTTNSVVATIPLTGRARGIHVSPDGKRVYVAISDDKPQTAGSADAIAVVDIATRKVVATHRVGSDPEQFAVTPDGGRLYASNEDGGTRPRCRRPE